MYLSLSLSRPLSPSLASALSHTPPSLSLSLSLSRAVSDVASQRMVHVSPGSTLNSKLRQSRPDSVLGGVPQEQKMLKGHLLRVIYHQVHKYTKINPDKLFPLRSESDLGRRADSLPTPAGSRTPPPPPLATFHSQMTYHSWLRV